MNKSIERMLQAIEKEPNHYTRMSMNAVQGGSEMSEPVKFSDIKRGMELWDNEKKRIAKVLRVYLWKEILAYHPNRFFKKKPDEGESA